MVVSTDFIAGGSTAVGAIGTGPVQFNGAVRATPVAVDCVAVIAGCKEDQSVSTDFQAKSRNSGVIAGVAGLNGADRAATVPVENIAIITFLPCDCVVIPAYLVAHRCTRVGPVGAAPVSLNGTVRRTAIPTDHIPIVTGSEEDDAVSTDLRAYGGDRGVVAGVASLNCANRTAPIPIDQVAVVALLGGHGVAVPTDFFANRSSGIGAVGADPVQLNSAV